MALYSSYIAIGDSFSEGYGDEGPDGVPRGWADFVALGLALGGLALGGCGGAKPVDCGGTSSGGDHAGVARPGG